MSLAHPTPTSCASAAASFEASTLSAWPRGFNGLGSPLLGKAKAPLGFRKVGKEKSLW